MCCEIFRDLQLLESDQIPKPKLHGGVPRGQRKSMLGTLEQEKPLAHGRERAATLVPAKFGKPLPNNVLRFDHVLLQK